MIRWCYLNDSLLLNDIILNTMFTENNNNSTNYYIA